MGIINSSINSLYINNSPAFSNLYTVEIYPINSTTTADNMNDYIKYHAESIEFQGESLTLERNEVTKKFSFPTTIAPYKRTDELTIKWSESSYLGVKKYHEDWLSNFYDKEHDHYLSAEGNKYTVNDRYRQIRIILPKYKGQNNIIVFDRVIPKITPGLNLEWSSSGSIIKHSITYYVESWRYDKTDVTILTVSPENKTNLYDSPAKKSESPMYNNQNYAKEIPS